MLTGLVIGSLWSIWPFKNTYVVGEETVYLSNKLPLSFGDNEWFTAAACAAGVVIVIVMMIIQKNVRKKEDAQEGR